MFNCFVLFAPYVCFHILSQILVTEGPPIGKIAAPSVYDVFSWYTCKYLIVNLVFSTSVLEWESLFDCAFS